MYSSTPGLTGSCRRQYDCELKQAPGPNAERKEDQESLTGNGIILERVKELDDVCCSSDVHQ